MVTNEKQFTYSIELNGERLSGSEIDDPFIHSTVHLRGFRHAWNALTKGITIRFNVGGTRKAIANVFAADYTPFPDGPKEVVGHCNDAESTR